MIHVISGSVIIKIAFANTSQLAKCSFPYLIMSITISLSLVCSKATPWKAVCSVGLSRDGGTSKLLPVAATALYAGCWPTVTGPSPVVARAELSWSTTHACQSDALVGIITASCGILTAGVACCPSITGIPCNGTFYF